MFNRWPVRYQVRLGTIILFVVVVLLTSVSFMGVLKFRSLAKSIRERSQELPLAANLSQEVSNLRKAYAELVVCSNPDRDPKMITLNSGTPKNELDGRCEFYARISSVNVAFAAYVEQLEYKSVEDQRIADITEELEVANKIKRCLAKIQAYSDEPDWILNTYDVTALIGPQLEKLQNESSKLPGLFHQRMEKFAVAAKSDYRALYLYNSVMLAIGLMAIATLFVTASRQIFRPLERMIRGSRRVAEGDYDHRIHLDVNGEMAVLAKALNEMTSNFQEIKRDLDDQVHQRTKEVLRSEQMASVGFLAAGLAHEINNPLAAIAWSAESLESRFLDLLQNEDSEDETRRQKDIDVICKYLRRIQDEAFRCKNITSGLLDYSRLDDKKKHPVEMVELIQSVVEMVRPLQKYAGRNIHFETTAPVTALVNAQEMKQVVLNLITNGLESVERGGNVYVSMQNDGERACLKIEDDGCGMTREVRDHLFEPFFTRRPDGSGTGLGLAITYRIIEEHQGSIEVFSEGENRGATFTVQLPLVINEQKEVKRIAA